jgi:hypothetical protein
MFPIPLIHEKKQVLGPAYPEVVCSPHLFADGSLKENPKLVDDGNRLPDRDGSLAIDTRLRSPLLDHLSKRFAVVPAPDDLVEATLKVLAAQVVVDTDQRALHLKDASSAHG